MPHKYSELVKPLSLSEHSPAQLVSSNPSYEKVEQDTEMVYTVSSPVSTYVVTPEPDGEPSRS